MFSTTSPGWRGARCGSPRARRSRPTRCRAGWRRSAANHPAIHLELAVGNTTQAVALVLNGEADLAFIEGAVDEPPLARKVVARDRISLHVAASHPLAKCRVTRKDLEAATWVMRERGSGTRDHALAGLAAEHRVRVAPYWSCRPMAPCWRRRRRADWSPPPPISPRKRASSRPPAPARLAAARARLHDAVPSARQPSRAGRRSRASPRVVSRACWRSGGEGVERRRAVAPEARAMHQGDGLGLQCRQPAQGRSTCGVARHEGDRLLGPDRGVDDVAARGRRARADLSEEVAAEQRAGGFLVSARRPSCVARGSRASAPFLPPMSTASSLFSVRVPGWPCVPRCGYRSGRASAWRSARPPAIC